MLKKIAIFILSNAVLLSSQYATAACNPDINQDIQSIVNNIQKKYKIPGMQVSISCGNDDVRDFVSGTTTLKGKTKVNSEHLFQLGYATLPYISVVMLQLETEGLLNIEDPISKYVSNLPNNWQAITIKQLLNVTSGIYQYTYSPRFWEMTTSKYEKQWTNEALLSLVSEQALEFNPGEGWFFSLTNYILAGMVIESVTHRSIDEELSMRIFQPLGLTNTYYQLSFNESFLQHMAHGYYDLPTNFFDKPKDITSQNLTWLRSTGAIITTAHDHAIFFRQLMSNHSLLPVKQQQELMSLVSMQTGQPLEVTDGLLEYGFGLGVLGIVDSDADAIWAMTGGPLGYNSEVYWLKCHDVLISSIVSHVDGNEVKGKRRDDLINQLSDLLLKNSDNLCKTDLTMRTRKAKLHKMPNSLINELWRVK